MAGFEHTALVGSIQRFSVEDGPGIRTTVFLKGCPLHCRWCHNPELIAFEQQLMASPNRCIGCGACIAACPEGAVSFARRGSEDGALRGVSVDTERCTMCLACVDECYAKALRPVAKAMTASQVLDAAERDRDFYDTTGGGLTLSGGELLSHGAFAQAVVEGASERGLGVCLDTSGYGSPELLANLTGSDAVTHILYDIKAVNPDVHKACTGVGNGLILDNLRMLAADARTRRKIVARLPLVAGLNDGDDDLRLACDVVRDLGISRVNLLSYHNFGVGKSRNLQQQAGMPVQREFEAPDEARMEAALALFAGLPNVQAEITGKR